MKYLADILKTVLVALKLTKAAPKPGPDVPKLD